MKKTLHQDYKTYPQKEAYDFISRHQQKENKKRCSTLSPALITRLALRTTIPIMFGLAMGLLTEWGDREMGLHKSSLLVELSDLSACAATLIATYTIDKLLNHCWPSDPYKNDFFSGEKFRTQNINDFNTLKMELDVACEQYPLQL